MKVSEKIGPPIVYVEWKDSASERGWVGTDRLSGAVSIRSVGLLVKSTKNYIVLSTSLSKFGNAVDPLSIPRKAVLKIKELRV